VKFKNIQFILDDDTYFKVMKTKGDKTWAEFVSTITPDILELDGTIKKAKK